MAYVYKEMGQFAKAIGCFEKLKSLGVGRRWCDEEIAKCRAAGSDTGRSEKSGGDAERQEPKAGPKRAAYPATQRNVYAGTGDGHSIEKNIGSGQFILLDDGSMWKIDPLDKLDASLWTAFSDITVVESTDGSPGYDFLLINTDDSEKAHAKYMGTR
jgi:hypothetical protein